MTLYIEYSATRHATNYVLTVGPLESSPRLSVLAKASSLLALVREQQQLVGSPASRLTVVLPVGLFIVSASSAYIPHFRKGECGVPLFFVSRRDTFQKPAPSAMRHLVIDVCSASIVEELHTLTSNTGREVREGCASCFAS